MTTLTNDQITAGAAVKDEHGRPLGRNLAIDVWDAMHGARPSASESGLNLDHLEALANQVNNGYGSAFPAYADAVNPAAVLELIALARRAARPVANKAEVKPICYLVRIEGKPQSSPYIHREVAEAIASRQGGTVVPLYDHPDPSAPIGATVANEEFYSLLLALARCAKDGKATLPSTEKLIAHIDQHVASQVQVAAPGWISVDERLPGGRYCLATYRDRASKLRIIRAMYVRQFEIEANGDECDSETNEENDLEYLKAGWYELIDNWGEYSSVHVSEGPVTHWAPLPPSPASESLRSPQEAAGTEKGAA